MNSRYLSELASMGRFGIVGVVACFTYIGVALAGDWQGFSPQKANLVAVLAGTVVSFTGHLFLSFRKSGVTFAYICRFGILSVFVYALSFAETYVGVTILGFPKPIVVLIVAVTMPLFTWVTSRFWVFGD